MATRSAGTSRLFDYRAKQEVPYDLGAPLPVPEVIDDDSEVSWALWREATGTASDWESDTEPMGLSAE